MRMLGFHYLLEPGELRKVNQMMVDDTYEEVRSACVYVIAHQWENPGRILLSVMLNDKSRYVKETALDRILEQFGVGFTKRNEIQQEIKRGRD